MSSRHLGGVQQVSRRLSCRALSKANMNLMSKALLYGYRTKTGKQAQLIYPSVIPSLNKHSRAHLFTCSFSLYALLLLFVLIYLNVRVLCLCVSAPCGVLTKPEEGIGIPGAAIARVLGTEPVPSASALCPLNQ